MSENRIGKPEIEKTRVWKIAYQKPGGEIIHALWKGSLFDFLLSVPRDTLMIGNPVNVTEEITRVGDEMKRIIAYSDGGKTE